MAFSGIAALLLPGGITSHLGFKIPLNVNDDSVSEIKSNTQLYDLDNSLDLILDRVKKELRPSTPISFELVRKNKTFDIDLSLSLSSLT